MAKQVLNLGIQNSRSVARAGCTRERILTACMPADKTGYDSTFMNYTNVPQWQNAIGLYSQMMSFAMTVVTKNEESSTCATNTIWRHSSDIALITITLASGSVDRAVLRMVGGDAQNLKFCILFVKPVNEGEGWMEVIHAPYESNPDNPLDCNGQFYELQSACHQASSVRKPRILAHMTADGKRTLMLTGNLGGGWLAIGHAPKFFGDCHYQIVSSINENECLGEEKEHLQRALDVDAYFSDDAEPSWSKMKDAVKVSLSKPEILRMHGPKTKCNRRISMGEVVR